jgi:hypothetical protein
MVFSILYLRSNPSFPVPHMNNFFFSCNYDRKKLSLHLLFSFSESNRLLSKKPNFVRVSPILRLFHDVNEKSVFESFYWALPFAFC